MLSLRRDGLLRFARNDGSTPELSLLFEIRVPSLRGAKRRSNPCSLRRDGLLRFARNDGSTAELSLLFEIRVPSLRGAKRRSNPCSLCGEMDCFASLAMTAQHLNCLCCLKLECRHCEKRSDEAIHSFFTRRDGLLRFARNDGVNVQQSNKKQRKRHHDRILL